MSQIPLLLIVTARLTWASVRRRVYSRTFSRPIHTVHTVALQRKLSFLTVQRHLDRTFSRLHSFNLPFHPDIPLFKYVFTDVCPYEEPVGRRQSCCISSWMVVFCYGHFNFFPNVQPFQGPFLLLCSTCLLFVCLLFLFVYPPPPPSMLLDREEYIARWYLDSIAQLTSTSPRFSSTDSVQFDYKCPFTVCILSYFHP